MYSILSRWRCLLFLQILDVEYCPPTLQEQVWRYSESHSHILLLCLQVSMQTMFMNFFIRALYYINMFAHIFVNQLCLSALIVDKFHRDVVYLVYGLLVRVYGLLVRFFISANADLYGPACLQTLSSQLTCIANYIIVCFVLCSIHTYNELCIYGRYLIKVRLTTGMKKILTLFSCNLR